MTLPADHTANVNAEFPASDAAQGAAGETDLTDLLADLAALRQTERELRSALDQTTLG